MSEEIIPEAAEEKVVAPDVAEKTVTVEPEEEPTVNYGEKSLAELTQLFQELVSSVDRLKKSKIAEAIRSAFYKNLAKQRAETAAEDEDPLTVLENGFKEIYAAYKSERAEYNKKLEQEREENLEKKKAVIEDLKALVEKQEDVNATFPEFREIQNRWREIGPVPATNFRDVNDTYQFYVEKFYDMVKINHDLRDLDFKKNLEAKEEFCQAAEKLAENENVVEAFKELQKLHEQWKEFGPVAKEFRDSIWERFKAATAVINKKYQAHFEEMKEQQVQNLEAKTKLCEEVEAIAEKEVASSNEWNSLSKEIEAIQVRWKAIGFATKKENQKIYDRFRAACDKFFERKRVFYSEFKDSMNDNLEKKMSIIEQAEALKDSKEWKKATDQFIALQKQWKEIGAVPRKKSEQIWKRFRAACDAFFDEKQKNAKPENDFYSNLKAKKALIEEIKAYEGNDAEAMKNFSAKWQEIGFVPFKEKDNISAAYKEAMQAKFPEFGQHRGRRPERQGRRPLSEREKLIQQYNKLQQDIDTYENNIGFFSASKNSAAMIKQMEDRIASAKEDLKALENKIRNTPED
ncbi:MAG: DUF349 domain-containing protein [Bacteroidales bacterium]|nr:DUF349 domain-containing protein [Bacteroidales bacterium]